jgi:hypothetical protein
MRYTSFLLLLLFLFSCHSEQKKDDFADDNYIETFGANTRTPLGNSGFSIDLPSTHHIDEINGDGFVEFHIRSTDTTINKGEGIVRFNLNADEKNESMVKDTAITQKKFDAQNINPNDPQIFVWTENEANDVERFNLAQSMNSIHR